MNTIDDFLKNYDLKRYQVSQVSGISENTLVAANKRPVSQQKTQVIFALAQVTGKTPGEVLDEMIANEGNPIIRFIRLHPYMDKELVQDVENFMIEAKQRGVNFKTVTFNRYYEEGEDTNERAEIAMKNFIKTGLDTMKKL